MATHCPKCNSENTDTARFCSDCGTQLIPSKVIPSLTKTLQTHIQRLTIGTLFANRYEIFGDLGRGGMGEVYRVKDQKLDEEMALKLLRPEIAFDESTIERFRNELRLARKISHVNVCRMFDFHEEEGTPYITMEYVDGEDLKSQIKKEGKITKEDTITIAKQVCEGLVVAHNLGVVHRDLKPQNIMTDEDGHVKIMDFGIARSVEAEGVTQTGMIIGTPDYISPEQAEGEEVDQRSDIYSLGVILYEMVTGTVPFKGDTALSVALKHKSQFPLDPRKLNPEVSDDLARLILICMEKDRERRYQTAEALLNDLRNIEEGLPLGTKIRPRRKTFVAALIRKKLLISAEDIARDIDLDIGQITTRSAEAFTYYNEGVKHWASGHNTEATESFKKAIDIDPQFAMAHIFLAKRYRGRLLHTQAREHVEKALSLTEHLTDRERYFVEAQAFYYGLIEEHEGKLGVAEERLKKILDLYPEDWLANYELGGAYLGREEWEKARGLFLENKRNKVDFIENYLDLAATYKFEGLYDKAIETYKYYQKNFSDSRRIRNQLASTYLCLGQLDMALEEVDNVLSLAQSPHGSWLKGAILMCMEDWLKAEEEFQRLIKEDTDYSFLVGIEGIGHMLRTQGKLKKSIERYEEGLREAKTKKYVDYEFFFHHHLAYANFQQGNLKEALNISDAALKLPISQTRKVKFQFLKGYIYLRMGSIKDAQDAVEELKNLLDNEMLNKLIRYYYLLMGLIECNKNNYKDAENFQIQALSLLPFPVLYAQRYDDHAVFFDALAMTYFRSGDFDNAQKQYERIISLTEGRLQFGVIYAKSYYMLGRIFEQKGWIGKSIEQYEKFLDLWKDADQGIAEFEDARKRLGMLR